MDKIFNWKDNAILRKQKESKIEEDLLIIRNNFVNEFNEWFKFVKPVYNITNNLTLFLLDSGFKEIGSSDFHRIMKKDSIDIIICSLYKECNIFENGIHWCIEFKDLLKEEI